MDNASEYEIDVLESGRYRDEPDRTDDGDSHVSGDEPHKPRWMQEQQQQQQQQPKDENAPLLRIPGAAWYQVQRPAGVIGVCAAVLFCLVMAAALGLMPMLRLTEDAICRTYYGSIGSSSSSSKDEKRCKVQAVQSQLAWIGGAVTLGGSFLALFTSFPWALLSDRVGRKPIFQLSFAGVYLSVAWAAFVLYRSDLLSLWLTLLSSLTLLMGGGVGVTLAVLDSMIADVTADRTSGFIYLGIGPALGAIIGPASAAQLMARSPWLPLSITLFLLAPLVFLLTVFLPETLGARKQQHQQQQLGTIKLPVAQSSAAPGVAFLPAVRAHLDDTWRRLKTSLRVLRRSRRARLLLPTFFFGAAMHGTQGTILAQHVSTRFGWTLADTGYLYSFKGLLTVLCLALLPAASALLVRRSSSRFGFLGFLGGFSEPAKDLLLARFSLVALAVGNLLMAGGSLAAILAGLVVSTLAVGLGSTTKSLMTRFYEEAMGPLSNDSNDDNNDDDDDAATDHTSRLYTLLGMVETCGNVLAGPVLAALFSAGMARGGGAWASLPFLYAAVLCVAALGCLLALPQADEDEVGAGAIAIA